MQLRLPLISIQLVFIGTTCTGNRLYEFPKLYSVYSLFVTEFQTRHGFDEHVAQTVPHLRFWCITRVSNNFPSSGLCDCRD